MTVGFYNSVVLPRLIHVACGMEQIRSQRQYLIPQAIGRVLEVGIGSGHNLPHYDRTRVATIIGVDPSRRLLRYATRQAEQVGLHVQLIPVGVEDLDLPSGSFDTVVMTFTLCSIARTDAALDRVRRILKPNGQLLFCEHGLSPDHTVRRWQSRVTPIWCRVAGGCHLDRDIPQMLERNGFAIDELRADYITGWRPASYTYRGSARPGN